MGFLDDYFEYQIEYVNKYGPKTAVALQKGTFYEVYKHPTKGTGIADIVADCLNFTLTRTDKKDSSSTLLCGLPVSNIDKYIKRLTENDIVVVVIDEKRTVVGIYSPGTLIDTTNSNNNYLSVIYIESMYNSLFFGLSFIDVSTGESYVMESIDGNNENRMENVISIMENYKPREIYVTSYNLNYSIKLYVKKTLQLETINTIKDDYIKLNYINSVFEKVYGKSVLSPIENLDLENYNYGSKAFSILCQFCYEHNEKYLEKMNKPILSTFNKLELHNNCSSQLSLDSLFKYVNKTKTAIGKRLLKKQIYSPYTDVLKIKEVQNEVESISSDIDWLHKQFENICDVERIHRKIDLHMISPEELLNLYNCYQAINIIVNKKNKQGDFTSFFNWYEKTFDLLDPKNIFNIGIYEEIDKLNNEKRDLIKSIDNECLKLSKILNKKENVIKFENNCLHTTQLRSVEIGKKSKNYSFRKDGKNKVIITSDHINTIIDNLIKIEDSLLPLIEHKFNKCLDHISTYDLQVTFNYIAYLDTLCCKSIISKLYNYSKPEIIESDDSFIECISLRHAIIEFMDPDVEYIPNDVDLSSINGLLLYGVNGSGKSCYSKAIGLAIILAQTGFYVPCKYMKLSPFHKLYTRTRCDDNIFKNQSSFVVEMVELRNIIKYADNKSFVIGDEICKGTEEISGLSIVGTTINWLNEKNVKFVFATHLHKLTDHIKVNETIKIMHITVKLIDTETMEYERKLKEGQGDKVYGLEVAKDILDNKEFYNEAIRLRNKVQGKTDLASIKKGTYNSKLLLDHCEICNSKEHLDQHHIEFQSDCPEKKNLKSNLVVLCKKCHKDVHSSKIIIDSWTQTSSGKILKFYYNEGGCGN